MNLWQRFRKQMIVKWNEDATYKVGLSTAPFALYFTDKAIEIRHNHVKLLELTKHSVCLAYAYGTRDVELQTWLNLLALVAENKLYGLRLTWDVAEIKAKFDKWV